MRAAAVSVLVAGALLGTPAAASAAPAQVDVIVVGRSATLAGPERVTLRAQKPKVGRRRCAVAARTPLAALLATRPKVSLRDYGSCGRATRDATGLFVRKVGRDANRGRNGWVYKVGRKAGTAGAADPAGPFGDGRRVRPGQRITWFWCVMGRRSCQRTLEVSPAEAEVASGGELRVTVRGYDDAGRGVAVEGATVRLGDAAAVTGADGVAVLAAPAAAGTAQLTAAKDGLVPSFPREVRVR